MKFYFDANCLDLLHFPRKRQLQVIQKILISKQDLKYLFKTAPPNPGPEFKNLDPILLSEPIALATSFILAPVTSHKALIELIELTLWARNAFEVSFANSLLQTLVVSIFSSETQFL